MSCWILIGLQWSFDIGYIYALKHLSSIQHNLNNVPEDDKTVILLSSAKRVLVLLTLLSYCFHFTNTWKGCKGCSKDKRKWFELSFYSEAFVCFAQSNFFPQPHRTQLSITTGKRYEWIDMEILRLIIWPRSIVLKWNRYCECDWQNKRNLNV